MINPPKTEEEAKNYRYNKWIGNKNGIAYNHGKIIGEHV